MSLTTPPWFLREVYLSILLHQDVYAFGVIIKQVVFGSGTVCKYLLLRVYCGTPYC